MTIDLRTSYLGLELRSPIVASAAPHNGDPERARRLEAGRGRCHRAAVAVRGGDPRRGARARPRPRAGHRAVRRVARLLPAHRPLRRGSRSLPDLARAGQGRRRRPGAREPERAAPAGGWVRHAQRIEAAGADALELNLYHLAVDPARPATTMEAERPGAGRGRSRRRHDPARGQAQPVLLGARELRPRGRRRRRGRARAVQPVLPARPRPRHARPSCPASSSAAPGRCACRSAGSRSCDPGSSAAVSLALTSGVHSGTDVVKGLLVGADVVMMTSALLLHGPEHVAAVEAELRAWMGDHELRVGGSAAWKREPGDGRGSGRVRAGQLHADAPLLDVRFAIDRGPGARRVGRSIRPARTGPAAVVARLRRGHAQETRPPTGGRDATHRSVS